MQAFPRFSGLPAGSRTGIEPADPNDVAWVSETDYNNPSFVTRWNIMKSIVRSAMRMILAGLLGGLTAAGSDMAFPPGIRLVMVPASPAVTPASLASADVPVFARFHRTGGEWLLVGADEIGLAKLSAWGLAVEIVDPDPAGATYFRVLYRTGRQHLDFAPCGRVVWDGGAERVIRAAPEEAELLAAMGLEIAAIRPRPIRLEPRPSSERPAAVVADPAISGIMGQLSQSMITDYEKALTGVVAAQIGGAPYTITRRQSNSGTPIQKATQYAYEQFQAMGLSASYDVWNVATNPNVIATRTGAAQPGVVYVLCAHLDDMPYGTTAPGADDNASGSAGVLAAAQAIAGSDYYFDPTLIFALWTGEEQGLLGSADWASWASSSGMDIQGVLNLDMIAYNSTGSAPILDLHARTDLPATVTLANLFADVAGAYVLDLAPEVLINQSTGDYSDNASFWDHGYPAILAIEDDDDLTPYYHTTSDTLASLNLPYFTAFAKASLGTFLHLCGGPRRYGDLDRDGAVGATDLSILIQYLNGNVSPGTPPFVSPSVAGDIDRDGAVNAADLVALAHSLAGP